MKKVTLILIVVSIFMFKPKNIYAQEIDNFKVKPFSLHNAKFSFGLGIDGSFTPFNIKANQPKSMKVIYKDPRVDSFDVSYVSAGISFDFYSPNSLMGLMFGVNYSFSDFTVTDVSKTNFDYFSINRLEFPAYLRLRPGKRDAKEHLLILFGGVYNLPISGTRKLITKSFTNYYQEDSIDNSIDQFNSFLSISTSIGFEFFEGKKNNSRMTAYINFDYPLGNALNNDYKDFKPGGNSTLSDFSNFKIIQLRIAIGLRYFFGFRKYK